MFNQVQFWLTLCRFFFKTIFMTCIIARCFLKNIQNIFSKMLVGVNLDPNTTSANILFISWIFHEYFMNLSWIFNEYFVTTSHHCPFVLKNTVMRLCLFCLPLFPLLHIEWCIVNALSTMKISYIYKSLEKFSLNIKMLDQNSNISYLRVSQKSSKTLERRKVGNHEPQRNIKTLN